MKMKKITSILMASALALSLSACGLSAAPAEEAAPAAEPAAVEEAAPAEEAPAEATSDAAASGDPEVTFVMAEVNPLDTIVGRMDMKFKEEVEARSGGSIHIDLQASGVLGSENDILDGMLGGAGTVQISRISAFALTNYGGNKSKLLSIPYTFVDRDHFWNFVHSDLAEEFLSEPSENGSGVRGLFYGEEGFRHFFTKDPVEKVEDFAGMKIRVSNDPVMVGMVNGLGASATEIAFGELYSALQTGVCDGAEQPTANYKSNAFDEVAPNFILDGHTLGAVQVIITDDAWNSLTEAQQTAVKEASQIASDYCHEISEEAENEVLQQLKDEGVNVVEVTDKAPWQEACKAVIEENTSDQADLYQQILDLAN